jgi:hypothetical protein
VPASTVPPARWKRSTIASRCSQPLRIFPHTTEPPGFRAREGAGEIGALHRGPSEVGRA